MSGPIQVIPPGLLGFFQLKINGRNPVDLLETVQPTLSMRDWYFEANALDWMQARGGGAPAGISVNTGVFGFQAFSPNALIVQPNEMWWVQNYTVTCGNFAVGDTINYRVAYRRPLVGTINNYELQDGQNFSSAVGAAATNFVSSSARGFFVPPGSELGFLIESNTRAAGQWSFTGFLRFTSLPL